jgi:iron(III) transport system substrate-binding protein
MRRLTATSALVLALALVLCGCGGSSQRTATKRSGFETVLAAVKGLHGPQREQKLRELARAEGNQLSLYTSMGDETIAAVAKAFGDAYGIDFAYYRADSAVVLPRLLEETKAGYHGADVVRLNGLAMFNLNKEGILVPYRSEYQRKLIVGAVQDGWTADDFHAFVVTWNTNLVPASERPRSWEDLADPRWRNRLALEASDVDWYATLWKYWVNDEGKTPQQADRLFEQIARGARAMHGHTALAQLMAAGEFAVAPNYNNSVDKLRAKGAPLAWTPAVEPLIVEPQGAGLARGARHPAAAVLFMDWLLSDGQKILVEKFEDPARRDLATAPKARRLMIDFASLARDQQEWTDRYERLLGRG